MAFDLEGDRPAFTHVHHTSIFAHANHQLFFHFVADFVAKLAQINFGRFVGAVLTPHHRIHRQLTTGGAASQNLTNLLVLVIFEA